MSLEAQRDAHKIRSHTLLTKIEELVTVLNQFGGHRKRIEWLKRLGHPHLMDKFELGGVFSRCSFFARFHSLEQRELLLAVVALHFSTFLAFCLYCARFFAGHIKVPSALHGHVKD